MTFEKKTTDQLVRIAVAGGGFALDGSHKTADELTRVAMAAAKSGAKVTFRGISLLRTTDEIVRISLAGKGNISFED